jgi:hypothetical protein
MRKLAASAIFAALALGATPALADINTVQPWIGNWQPFGESNTTIYGQTFTVGAQTQLDSFSLYLAAQPNDGVPVDFNAYIYEWDGQKAAGPQLYGSADQAFTGSPAEAPVEFAFNTGGLNLVSGKQYVAFLQAKFDGRFSTAEMPYSGNFFSDPYDGGSFVYFNTGTDDVSAALASSWDVTSGYGDVWFKADFAGGAGAVPEPGAWALMILGFGAAGSMVRRKRALTA